MSAREAGFSDTSLSLSEFANLFGFPIDAIAAAVETQRQRASARQAFSNDADRFKRSFPGKTPAAGDSGWEA